MSKEKSIKHKITLAVYNSLTAEQKSNLNTQSIEKLITRWFITGRTSTGLRLSEEGRDIFTLADIEYFDYNIVKDVDTISEINKLEFALTLGKKIKCPFYIGLKNKQAKSAYIRIYDSKVAMMINLYGSFDEYLKSLKRYA